MLYLRNCIFLIKVILSFAKVHPNVLLKIFLSHSSSEVCPKILFCKLGPERPGKTGLGKQRLKVAGEIDTALCCQRMYLTSDDLPGQCVCEA